MIHDQKDLVHAPRRPIRCGRRRHQRAHKHGHRCSSAQPRGEVRAALGLLRKKTSRTRSDAKMHADEAKVEWRGGTRAGNGHQHGRPRHRPHVGCSTSSLPTGARTRGSTRLRTPMPTTRSGQRDGKITGRSGEHDEVGTPEHYYVRGTSGTLPAHRQSAWSFGRQGDPGSHGSTPRGDDLMGCSSRGGGAGDGRPQAPRRQPIENSRDQGDRVRAGPGRVDELESRRTRLEVRRRDGRQAWVITASVARCSRGPTCTRIPHDDREAVATYVTAEPRASPRRGPRCALTALKTLYTITLRTRTRARGRWPRRSRSRHVASRHQRPPEAYQARESRSLRGLLSSSAR